MHNKVKQNLCFLTGGDTLLTKNDRQDVTHWQHFVIKDNISRNSRGRTLDTNHLLPICYIHFYGAYKSGLIIHQYLLRLFLFYWLLGTNMTKSSNPYKLLPSYFTGQHVAAVNCALGCCHACDCDCENFYRETYVGMSVSMDNRPFLHTRQGIYTPHTSSYILNIFILNA